LFLRPAPQSSDSEGAPDRARLRNNGAPRTAQRLVNPERPPTTKRLDRSRDRSLLSEVERIAILL
jgi:hypothetical protein